MNTDLSTFLPASLTDALPIPLTWAAEIFERLSAQLGTKIADLFAGVDPKLVQAEWAAGLAGFHKAEIARGIAACRERVFAPTLGEFLRLCRPSLDPEWAWYEAGDGLRRRDDGEMGDWSHPAVWRAACVMSSEVRGGDYQRHRTRWVYTLKREFSAGWGDGVKPPLVQIAHKPTAGRLTDERRAALATARTMLVSAANRRSAKTAEPMEAA